MSSLEVEKLVKLIKKARFCWVAGNGGSASTAEHFVTDLVKKGYPAICLNSNTSLITMISNDYSYSFIFSKQLEIYAGKNDLLITISCSGRSRNIREVLLEAQRKEVKSYKFETFGEETDYGLLEDKHLKFVHEVAKAL